MKNIFSLLLILIFAFTACSKADNTHCSEEPNENISQCIKEKVEEFKTDMLSIAVFKISDDECLYYFNSKIGLSDGPQYILNNQCDTVCEICGECFSPSCAKKLLKKLNKDKFVWKK
jgi:hypothetical protein